VDVRIGNATLPGVYVVGDNVGQGSVLGRNVLNKWLVMLNGPAQQVRVVT
jgi:hypothetical protein